jgi:IclR family KDG regulon transcriptional repressor
VAIPTAAQPKTTNTAANCKYLVPVVLNTFRILAELSHSGPLSLAELVQRVDIAKSTVFRILNTLHHLGYVWRDNQHRTYAVSPRLAELSHGVDWGTVLQPICLPYMARLRGEFGETVNLARLDFDRIVYLEVVESEHALRLCERRGGWEYAHASALGKAILAYSQESRVTNLLTSVKLPKLTERTITEPDEFLRELRRIRQRGYAFDREEARAMAGCIGAPILDRDGLAVAGMSISGPSSRFNPARDRKVQVRLTEVTVEISARLAEIQDPAVASTV